MPLTFTAAKVFVNIFSRKYYFTNNLEITLAGAKFWTLCCVVNDRGFQSLIKTSQPEHYIPSLSIVSCNIKKVIHQVLGKDSTSVADMLLS